LELIKDFFDGILSGRISGREGILSVVFGFLKNLSIVFSNVPKSPKKCHVHFFNF
jgi:hypothetical protein